MSSSNELMLNKYRQASLEFEIYYCVPSGYLLHYWYKYLFYAPNKSKIINTNTEKMHFTLQSLKDWYVISLFIYCLNDFKAMSIVYDYFMPIG